MRKQVATEEVVQAELEAQRRLLEVEHQRKMAAIRDEMENEVIICKLLQTCNNIRNNGTTIRGICQFFHT